MPVPGRFDRWIFATVAMVCAVGSAEAEGILPDCRPPDAALVGGAMIVKTAEATEELRTSFVDWLRERKVAGIYLSKRATRHLSSPAELADYVAALRSASGNPDLLVSVDQEGGKWQGLDAVNGFAPLKSAAELCKSMTAEEVAVYAEKEIGAPLASVGVTMDFAPVIDVALEAQSEIIVGQGRACSEDPDEVAAYGVAVGEGLRHAGLMAVAKHFPGHGHVAGDTHRGLVRSSKPIDRLLVEDLVPFRSFVEARAGAVMVSHIIMEEIDPTAPASLSAEVIDGLLRRKLSFQGLVITDDLSMRAVSNYVSGDVGLAALKAIEAGADLLVLGHEQYDEAVERICRSLNEAGGAVIRSRLEASRARMSP